MEDKLNGGAIGAGGIAPDLAEVSLRSRGSVPTNPG
jgi:hypothetical protein